MKTRTQVLPLAALAITLIAVFGIGQSVQADTLAVDNADFAKILIPLGPGGSSYTYTFDNWVKDGADNDPWISHNYYAPADPTPASEFMVSHSDNIYQDLADTFQSGATIDFSMIAGVRTSTTHDSWRLFIYDATAGSYATPLAEATGTVAVDGGWHPINLEYTPTPAVDGHTIGIGFGAAGSSGYHYLYYDNAVVSVAGPDETPPTVLDIVNVGGDTWEVKLEGNSASAYVFRESATLDFTSGTLVENLTPGVPEVGTIGGTNASEITTDGTSGNATVQMTLLGPANFVRAEESP